MIRGAWINYIGTWVPQAIIDPHILCMWTQIGMSCINHVLQYPLVVRLFARPCHGEWLQGNLHLGTDHLLLMLMMIHGKLTIDYSGHTVHYKLDQICPYHDLPLACRAGRRAGHSQWGQIMYFYSPNIKRRRREANLGQPNWVLDIFWTYLPIQSK